MSRVLRGTFLALAVAALLTPAGVAAQQPVVKVKKTGTAGVAGAVTAARPQKIDKRTIYGNWSEGFYCVVGEFSNTHELGWIPRDTAITIDFWSDDTSDPIAILSSLQFENGNAGGERFNSDDDGGNLNPAFRLMKPYSANWVLTVGTADDGVACYSFKVTLQ